MHIIVWYLPNGYSYNGTLPVKHRGVRRFCVKHSLKRAHRVDGRLFNRNGGVKLPLAKVPFPLRKKYAKLFAKWNDLDSGCGVVALSQRPDISALRRFNKELLPKYKQSQCDLVAWSFVAHRLYDPAIILQVVLPSLEGAPQFTWSKLIFIDPQSFCVPYPFCWYLEPS